MKTHERIASELVLLAREMMADSPYKEKKNLDEVKRDMEHASIRSLNAVLNLGPKAKLVKEMFLTFSEGASHKFHFFALYDDGGTMKAGNAYGRIGGNVTAIKIGEGRDAEGEFYKKLRAKRNKGYEAV
jgi:predicted DNA-binding WGR domain protein